MAAVSPNSLSVRSLAGKWGPGCCWLSHTSHRSWSAARTAAALPPVTRMALASAWFEGCPKFVCIERRLAINLRSSSVVRSGSGWSLGRTRTLVAGNVSFTVDVIRLSATKWGFYSLRRQQADTQSDSTREEEALEQRSYRQRWKHTLCKGSCGSNSWQTGWEYATQHRSEGTEQTKQWRVATFFRHDPEAWCTLAAERQRELIKSVAIDWSNLSVRGSCLFLLARRRTGISSIKFVSLCQFCGFNRNARCPARLTTKSSTPVPILSVFSPISTTARAGVRKSRPIKEGKCFEGTTLKTILPLLPTTKTGAVTLIEETSVPPSPNLYLSPSRVSSISCFRPKSSSKLL